MDRDTTSKSRGGGAPVWRRVGIWGLATLGAAFVGLAATALWQGAGDWIAGLTAGGPLVKVRVDEAPSMDDVSIPHDESLSRADLDRLSVMDVEDADAWLEEYRSGVPSSERSVALTLTGNRPDPVRVMDMKVQSACHPPDRGTLVVNVEGRGGGSDSEHMIVYPEEDDHGPFLFTAGAPTHYFPARTISLEQGEQVVVVIDIEPGRDGMDWEDPASTRVCDVRLGLKIMNGDTEVEEPVPGSFSVMDVEPHAAYGSYGAIYVGTGMCNAFYKADDGWDGTDVSEVCGARNVDFGIRGE
ncbi:hypothetical protein G5T42_04180 [Microbacterium sp. 4R-513]|uniref:hypothetical protein n=1 Tax=Microbacterium sp. 4R-513 TaxID=2567934 RepID=UPI0013E1DC09|nr:hypothetical protein [Microbacterium sp. 4R-513]QIG38782.1 hypothetical protein G5T42_04180 [Microbacterium sp. 4R-513]